jgi:ABC-2 type transport system permease protein
VARRDSLWHALRIYCFAFRLQVRSAMRLRLAFVLQIAGMMLNNAAIIVAWLFLFSRFGTINGWGAAELIALVGMNMFVFGLVVVICGGILDLPRHVDRGSLDSYLTKPAPLLIQLATSNLDVSAFGDLLLGFGLITWYATRSHLDPAKFAVFILALVISVVIFWCFAIMLPSTMAFYIYDSERVSRFVGQVLMDAGTYPTGVLTGVIRTVLLTLLPGLYLGAVPVDVLHRFTWPVVLAGVLVALAWLVITLVLFRHALKRYESSNLVGEH